MVRRYPEIGPEFLRGIGGPAVLLLFCLAPHGVFPAISLTRDAVSSYLAFSPLPALFSKNRRYLFCDTFRQRSLSRTPPAYFTRHAAVWCSDFPLANLTTHQRPSAIAKKVTSLTNAEKREVALCTKAIDLLTLRPTTAMDHHHSGGSSCWSFYQ
jgi:hypothetical protein